MTPPVLLIVFRRPETTRRVFDAIAGARPSTLFVAADGPRTPDEAAACEETRAIATAVTWPCEVRTDFAPANLGCRDRPASAISWFFDHVESGIVLEDDVVPSPDFFRFCADMLRRYRDDDRILHVSGETYARKRRSADSYGFSKYALTWGWATWRRAWSRFDLAMRSWPAVRGSTDAAALWDTRDEESYLTGVFDQMYAGQLPTAWDYAWWYACLTGGLSIHPAVNLVTNVGAGHGATHTGEDAELIGRPTGRLDDPLRHPPSVVRDREGDLDTFDLRLVGAVLKRQRSLRQQVGRPWRWLRRQAGF